MGETFAAVNGAFMVICLKHGTIKAIDFNTSEKTYELAKELATEFTSRNKSIVCKALLGHDLSTPAGRNAVKGKTLTTTLCPKFVIDAVDFF